MDPVQPAQQPSQQAQVQQAAPPQAPAAPKKNPINKILLILLGILVLAGTAGGAYYLGTKQNVPSMVSNQKIVEISPTTIVQSPTPDQAESWQTYTDTKYHFSIKLPPEYKKVGEDTITDQASGLVYEVTFMGNIINDGIMVEIFDNPNQLTAIDYVKTLAFKNDLPGWNNKDLPTQVVKIANTDAVRIERVVGGAGDYGPVVFISELTYMYKIHSQNLGSKTNIDVFNQATPTFTFFQ